MEEAQRFLNRLRDEFPAALKAEDQLPVVPLSRRVTEDELQGESLDVGLRLLTDRGAPPGLAPLLCWAALVRLLKNDLSPFHCPKDAEQEDEEPLLQSENVQRLFINELIAVSKSWLQTPADVPAVARAERRCSAHAIRNSRRKMEDKHVLLTDFNELFGLQDGVDRAYFAVFDGHGGVDAAAFAATHLHVALSRQDTLQSDADAAFKAAFKRTDDMFRVKAKRERLRSGSTGVAVLIQGQQLTVSWLGDSQAMLVRRGRTVTLMEPHKPEREDEKQRIEELGGCVTFMGCWRVNGTYAVSRAIGDFDQKPYVSGDADCCTVLLLGDEDFLLLACDGFFDAVTPEEVPGLVQDALSDAGESSVGGGAGVAQRLPPEQLLRAPAEDSNSQNALQPQHSADQQL
uniref:PPM-type phosphatase domain-containing protein n=1 Tax=Gouania willdenowi TaxID=441366 RepID=A0A8C5EWF6_GOUWI